MNQILIAYSYYSGEIEEDENKLKEWQRWCYGLFSGGGFSGNINKYILDASRTLRFESL